MLYSFQIHIIISYLQANHTKRSDPIVIKNAPIKMYTFLLLQAMGTESTICPNTIFKVHGIITHIQIDISSSADRLKFSFCQNDKAIELKPDAQ